MEGEQCAGGPRPSHGSSSEAERCRGRPQEEGYPLRCLYFECSRVSPIAEQEKTYSENEFSVHKQCGLILINCDLHVCHYTF